MPLCAFADDPLEDAIGEMRTVQKRIAAGDTGEKTRKIQGRIVENLQKLISQARRQPPPPNPNTPSPKQQPEQSSQANQEGQPADAQSTANKDPANRPSGGQNDAEEPKDSDDRLDPGRDRETLLLRRRELAQAVWGHLPPGVREKLLNIYSEKYLPEYEELIHRYFEALAEQGTNHLTNRTHLRHRRAPIGSEPDWSGGPVPGGRNDQTSREP